MARQRREWAFYGYLPMKKSTPDGEKITRIPFAIRSPDGHPGTEEIRRRAHEVGRQFMQHLQDTIPANRFDQYGQPGEPVFTFVGTLEPGQQPTEI